MIANPWDAGTARILAGLGFEALATSSGASAGVLGRRDGKVTREEALAQPRDRRGDRPAGVADLEKGFGDAPEAAAETIRLAAGAGLVGGSIEDATGDKDAPLYDLGHATERIAAAVKAARALPFPFMLTARSENYLRGNPTSRTRSAACRPSRRPAPTCCSRRGCRTSTQCARSARRSRSRSTSWWASAASRSAWPSSRRPA